MTRTQELCEVIHEMRSSDVVGNCATVVKFLWKDSQNKCHKVHRWSQNRWKKARRLHCKKLFIICSRRWVFWTAAWSPYWYIALKLQPLATNVRGQAQDIDQDLRTLLLSQQLTIDVFLARNYLHRTFRDITPSSLTPLVFVKRHVAFGTLVVSASPLTQTAASYMQIENV